MHENVDEGFTTLDARPDGKCMVFISRYVHTFLHTCIERIQ